jgi:hypothetical protein
MTSLTAGDIIGERAGGPPYLFICEGLNPDFVVAARVSLGGLDCEASDSIHLRRACVYVIYGANAESTAKAAAMCKAGAPGYALAFG